MTMHGQKMPPMPKSMKRKMEKMMRDSGHNVGKGGKATKRKGY